MSTPLLAILFALGLTGGFFSGLLGIGGGIIMVPLLLYIPSLAGVAVLSMKTAAGITMVQSLAGAFSSLVAHRKNKFVHLSLVMNMGTASILGALVGSLFSKNIDSNTMLGIFACMALMATLIMFLPKGSDDDEADLEEIKFNKYLSFFVALLVGLLGGIVGQGGSFILIPLMLYLIKIPTRIALGSSSGIAFLSALAGFIGKYSTGQIPFMMALVLVSGSVLGAQFGGYISKKLKTTRLRLILNIIIAGTALRMWYQLNTTVFYLLLITGLILMFVIFLKTQKTKNKKNTLEA